MVHVSINIGLIDDNDSVASDSSKLRFIKRNDGYYVYFSKTEWGKINAGVLYKTMMESLKQNLPNEKYKISVYTSDELMFNAEVLTFKSICINNPDIDSSGMEQHPFHEVPNCNIFEDFVNAFDDEEECEDPLADIVNDADEHAKKYHGVSRIFKDSNHVKRSINRHGVIVAEDKSIKRDKKILKEFLNDFIPGKESWKKEFRKEILKRWLSTYTITKKELKKLEKDVRNKKSNRTNRTNIKKSMGIASKILKKDTSWFDPSK